MNQVEFLMLYKQGLVQYLSPGQFAWVTGISTKEVYRNIKSGIWPFRKPVGSGRFKIHISHVSAIMAGSPSQTGSPPGDAQNRKRSSVESIR